MTPSAVLAGYALLAAVPAAQALARARWPQRAPRLGLAAWLALVAATLSAALLACLTLVIPPTVAGHDLAHLLHDCLHHLGLNRSTGANASAAAGALGAAALTTRLAGTAARHHREVTRIRRRQHTALALLAGTEQQIVILPHRHPTVYCLPGRHPRVVVTDAALSVLRPDQLAGVIAHEHAHLRGRHAALVTLAAIPARAFGWLPVFTLAHREVTQLVEMLADDAATSACTGPRLAQALLSLAEHRTPTAALAAGGPGTLRRAWRLLTPLPPMGVPARLATAATVAAVVAAPLALAVTPALLALHCNDPSAADLVGQWRPLR